MTATVSPNIEFDASGNAVVAGTRTKVIEVALDRIAHHWDSDEIQRQHPHLSLAQIHAALAYYYEHQPEFDRAIADQLQRVAELRRQTEDPVVRQKLLQARATS